MVKSEELKEILIKAAYAGGGVLRTYFQSRLTVSLKNGIHDTVTEADHKAQEAIVESIHEESQHTSLKGKVGFLGEEGLYTRGEYLFVIDPLDGTTNFAAGLPYFSVSIGVLKDNVPLAGVVYHVMENTVYLGIQGKGAFMNDVRFSISTDKILNEAYLITNLSKREDERTLRLNQIEKVYKRVRAIRVLGSIALDISHVASGRGEIAWAGGALWDIVAAAVILTEAGGEVADYETGQPLELEPENAKKYYRFIAGEKKLITKFRSYLS